MKIAIASDHRGFDFKKQLCRMLSEHNVVDFGPQNAAGSVDYPDFAVRVGRSVASNECERGILVCGSGIGMSLAANKVKGIRAVVANNLFSVEMSRRHNDSNVLCFGADQFSPGAMVEKMVHLWIETPFEGERHARRVQKITDLEGS
ncbi:MAG: ribose 5-phosphate isomerase B [Planctomycetes bacterium]|nr:ribose 5-phosphate isomerase B [Planctomycetota bacterium]